MHRSVIARIIFLALLPFLSDHSAEAQQVQILKIGRDLIEERLRMASTRNADRKEDLLGLFTQVGCNGEQLLEQAVKTSPLPNVVCTLPGTTDSVLIVGAHYDMVDQGKGVVDNWSGVSLLPTLFESLSSHPRRHTFVFISTLTITMKHISCLRIIWQI